MDLIAVIIALSALLAATLGSGLVLRWRQGRPRRFDPTEVIEPTRLGAERLGETATLLQFSTQTCGRCPGVHRTLRSIADDRDGVLHLNVDLTHRADIARHFHVLQTPTTLILDRHGVVKSRFGGTPGRQVVEMELDRVAAGAAQSAAAS